MLVAVYTAAPSVPIPGPPGLLLGLSVLNLGLAWWTLRSLDRRPFPMVLVMGTLHLISGVWEFLEDGTWHASLAWALMLGIIAVDARRIERLALRHPELYLSKRLRGEHLTTRDRGRQDERAP